jgi:hypothetical protein
MEEPKKDLIAEAMKVFGISKQFVLSSRMDGDEAVIVTAGGTKIRYKAGDKVEPLGPDQLIGGTPKKGKPITGGKK